MISNVIGPLSKHLVEIISETNGLSIVDTIELSLQTHALESEPMVKKSIQEFRRLLSDFQQDELEINTLLNHPFSEAMFNFFKDFPLHYKEEHIHLTGSLTADFIYPRLKKLLKGPNKDIYLEKMRAVYGDEFKGINSVEDVDRLIRLQEDELFDRYLQILLLPKLILIDRKTHKEAAYHMANDLYHNYNIGQIRLKFTLSRANQIENEMIPGSDQVSEEDVVMGLYDGFMAFKKEHPDFNFILSPCFRKEADFFDAGNFKTKKEHFLHQVEAIIELLEKFPELKPYLTDVDTVGNERDLYRKSHFQAMQQGFRKLHYKGFAIRSHHGETWHTLRKGVQAVDNSLNIWHIDTLEHGLSLGINPNYYYHSMYQRIMAKNRRKESIIKGSTDYKELEELEWGPHEEVKHKLLEGIPLDQEEERFFIKSKFHTAREVEHYQHDVLNRMMDKSVSLIALPTSNKKLTNTFPDYKDHPFSWWEKKGVQLGIGTDNYVTLNTNYIQEMMILLYTDAENLKITKLLMVASGESRRPYISQLLWKMREKYNGQNRSAN